MIAAMLAALFLQTSLLLNPLRLEATPPELRSARNILLLHQDAQDAPPSERRSKAETLAFARELALRLRPGACFVAAAEQHSRAPNARAGAVLGTFPPHVLMPELDAFLFSAAPGAISDPFDTPSGVQILQRIDTWAAVLEIRLPAGDDAEHRGAIEALSTQLRAGADFAELARTHSINAEAAARGGQFAIFERGARDTLLKAQAFDLAEGAISAPLASPLGWHLLKRVPVAALDASLRENNWIRVRAILVQHDKAVGADPAMPRNLMQAKAIADDLFARLRAGAVFAELAREFDDDPGGKARAGDLGWVYRFMPDLPRPFAAAFALPAGGVELHKTPLGFVLVLRER
jgi:parvulin-like peptidyl-prolyl isomerase